MIRRGTYQEALEDSRWEYEPVSYLWPDIEPGSDSSNDGSNDEVSKYQENHYDQEKEEVISVLRRNPKRLIRGGKMALQLIRSDIEN